MPIQTLNTIKTWFKTGLKPSQQQFWDTWDSFRHKFEKVPLKDIDNLEQTLNEKAEKSEFDNHLTNANAHSELFLAKEDKANKGIANGYAPLDEFSKIASKYLTIVNNLITNSETSLLSAQQGVVLQNQINGINTLLQSDNVNLDTLQEIVNAIGEIELSLNTILVNDLTTGGATKALTAEMGKLLQSSKEDKSQKGVSGGYAPLNNFTKLASQYLDIVNDLVSGGSTSLLSAEQGKILQNQINVINSLLASDDINLDTLQEIVNAIKDIQGYLNTILVNDLVTGGVTKALTAEMGKKLNEIKLTATIATDVETQIMSAVLEDNKVVSRSKLFNWWNWVKLQSQTISGMWLFTNKVTFATGNTNEPSLLLPLGTLTSTPKNGAIERDENGELYETHNNIRSKIITQNNIIKGEFKNNTEALAAGLLPGDLYNLPINEDNAQLCIVKKVPPSIRLTFDIDSDGKPETCVGNPYDLNEWNQALKYKTGLVFSSVEVTDNSVLLISDGTYFSSRLDLVEMNLTDIEIKGLDMITHLNLPFNKFSTFNPGKSSLPSNLKYLDLGSNLLTNFNCTLPDSLQTIELEYNKLVQFNPTIALPNSLEFLRLGNNQLNEFNPTIPLPVNLRELSLNWNKLREFDFSILPNKIRYIDLTGNGFTSFNPKFPLPDNLTSLELSNNNLTNFNPTYPLNDNLIYLGLRGNRLTRFDPALPLPNNLSFLGLSNNQLTNFDPALPLPNNLGDLDLTENKLSSFAPKLPLPDNLMGLGLSYNELTRFDPALPLPNNLSFLGLDDNRLTSFNPRLPLPDNLDTLDLSYNQLTHFDPTLPLPDNLDTLDLSYNQLTSFDPALPLPNNLKNLKLDSNQLTYFNPVQKLSSLRELFLINNPITRNSWNTETNWISSLKENGRLYCHDHEGYMTGTNTETLLRNKNWTIY